MDNSIVLVTAFFNIGRERFKAIPRTDSKYFRDFESWARLRNRLVVYTQPEMKETVLAVREKFGLRDNTVVIEIDDIFEIEPGIFSRMKEISANKEFADFRLLPNATSNIAEYSYLMLLKSYFLQDAVSRGLASGQMAWIDFGFNHGGDLYTNPEEFSFEWKYPFEDKIYYFYYQAYDDRPIFEIVRRLSDCIMGCLIIVPSHLASELWRLNKEAMKTLNDVGLIDDDQLIHLMSYRKRPEIFRLVESEWFLPLKTYGGSDLISLRKHCAGGIRSFARKVKNGLKKWKLAFRYSYITLRNLMK